MTNKCKYKVHPVVSIRCVNSSFYEVFNPDENSIVPVNQTGKDIIAFLSKDHTLDEICLYLNDLYDVDLETLKEDTSLFLKEMHPDYIMEISV